MASLEELRSERLKKLQRLQSAGQRAYPITTQRLGPLADIKKTFQEGKILIVAGRVKSLRPQGGIIFFDLDDGTDRLQIIGSKETENFELLAATLDLGDIIETKGKLVFSHTGQPSLKVTAWRMLAKALRPPPSDWHGLKDTEERFRRRYLDSLFNEKVKTRFLIRAKIITVLRRFLEEAGFVEFETPILQPLAGGAMANPFVTHHNALEIDFYLRVAPELYLKELLIGGFSKVYELGRNFRNEGIDATHQPEFTMLEFYEAYSDANRVRSFVEELLRRLVKTIIGREELIYQNEKINFAQPFTVMTYESLFQNFTPLQQPFSLNREQLRQEAKKLGIKTEETETAEKILDHIYKKLCRPKLTQPTFIIDYPAAFSPFAKRQENRPELIDRFQLIIAGMELVNAFSELNDPLDQRERYQEQDQKKRAGEEEISPFDETYLEALEYGLPPAGGVGLGVDRLVMLLTDCVNIREAIYFPTLKPKKN